MGKRKSQSVGHCRDDGLPAKAVTCRGSCRSRFRRTAFAISAFRHAEESVIVDACLSRRQQQQSVYTHTARFLCASHQLHSCIVLWSCTAEFGFARNTTGVKRSGQQQLREPLEHSNSFHCAFRPDATNGPFTITNPFTLALTRLYTGSPITARYVVLSTMTPRPAFSSSAFVLLPAAAPTLLAARPPWRRQQ